MIIYIDNYSLGIKIIKCLNNWMFNIKVECKMKKTKISMALLSFTLLLITVPFAQGIEEATGTIRIDPSLPLKSSTGEFSVYTTGGKTTYDPHIFLVMTKECYLGLSGSVTVDWGSDSLSIAIGDWVPVTDGGKLPSGTTSGAGYQVSALRDHLPATEYIYYYFDPTDNFLSGQTLTGTGIDFTITLPSSDPNMLVYVLGKSCNKATLFDRDVPKSIPGFVVPEPATIAAVATPTLTLLAYALFKRKTIFS